MMASRQPYFIVSLLFSATMLAGCDSGVLTGCSSVFLARTVTVVDSSGAPVNDASVIATLARTGAILSPTSLALYTAGTYIVIDDGSRKLFRAAGDTVIVTAVRGTGPGLTVAYVVDVPGGCHVNIVSGPDTLTLP